MSNGLTSRGTCGLRPPPGFVAGAVASLEDASWFLDCAAAEAEPNSHMQMLTAAGPAQPRVRRLALADLLEVGVVDVLESYGDGVETGGLAHATLVYVVEGWTDDVKVEVARAVY